jgi:predicted Zn-dependent protease
MTRMNTALVIRTAGLAPILALLAACETVQTTQAGLVGVDRKQHMLVSSDDMNKGAAEAYKKVLADAQSKGQLNRDPAQVERVRRIANRLIPNTAAFRADAPKWGWEINVLTTSEVNAWCMPGGKIAVYTGLIDKIKPTDDELAAVMGHEISHALREHSREQASQQAAEGMVLGVIGAAAGLSNTSQQLAQLVTNVTFDLPHSRQDETEADRIGVELAARSGYDPRAAVSLWQKMNQLGGSAPPQILSTHPSSQSRIDDLKVYSERVEPLYQASKK